MNNIPLFIFAFLFPVSVFAQTGAIDVAGQRVIYDHEEVVGGGTNIYLFDGSLVLSTHDSDDDGKINYWILYENDVVVKEVQDTDRNGQPDLIMTIDAAGEVESISGERVSLYTAAKPQDFWNLTKTLESPQENPTGLVRQVEDLVGDVSRIDIPSRSYPWWMYVSIVVVLGAGGGYWWRQRRVQVDVAPKSDSDSTLSN